MVPKGFAIFDMDVTSKGLSWIDQMYQKFEAICVEVDENSSILLQETTKYVENQVTVVGTNVRKLCEEVIQDILPPAPDAAIKSLASDISIDFVDEFELFEKPKSNPKKLHTLNVESVVSPKSKQNYVSSKSSDSDICIDFAEEFEMFEKPKLNPKKLRTLNVESVTYPKLEQSYVSSGQDSVCAFQVPDKLQNNHPVPPQEKPSEFPASDILEQLPCPSVEDLSVPEDLGLKNEAQKQSLRLQLEANACDDLLQGALLKSPADKTGAELYEDNQKIEDICIGGMQVNDHPIHRDGIDEIIRESEVHCMVETGNCQENVEVHEEARETFFSIIESFIPDPANLSKGESFHELLAAPQDEKEESAYWYETEDVQKPYMVDISTPDSLLDMNVEKWQHVENCDSEWEFL